MNKSYKFSFKEDGSLDEARINGKDLSEEDKKVMENYFKQKDELYQEYKKQYEDVNIRLSELNKMLDKADEDYKEKVNKLEMDNVKAVFEKYPAPKNSITSKPYHLYYRRPLYLWW